MVLLSKQKKNGLIMHTDMDDLVLLKMNIADVSKTLRSFFIFFFFFIQENNWEQ